MPYSAFPWANNPAGGTPIDADNLNRMEAGIALGVTTAESATAALPAKAPLASPAFTGVPTAPTAAPGTNTTQLATMAAVQAAITALIGGAPGALDTLDELSAAIADDPNFAATIATALGLRAPLASPALTGTPTVPTGAAGLNTTQAASTAFVQQEIANLKKDEIGFSVDFGGSVIEAGVSDYMRISGASTITAAEIVADIAGDVTVEVWRATYAAFPTFTKLSASAPMTLTAQQKNQPALTGWTTALADGDYVQFRITGTPTFITKLSGALILTRS